MGQQRFVTIGSANQAAAQIECPESITFPDLTKSRTVSGFLIFSALTGPN
jgi:hypothetical protein